MGGWMSRQNGSTCHIAVSPGTVVEARSVEQIFFLSVVWWSGLDWKESLPVARGWRSPYSNIHNNVFFFVLFFFLEAKGWWGGWRGESIQFFIPLKEKGSLFWFFLSGSWRSIGSEAGGPLDFLVVQGGRRVLDGNILQRLVLDLGGWSVVESTNGIGGSNEAGGPEGRQDQ